MGLIHLDMMMPRRVEASTKVVDWFQVMPTQSLMLKSAMVTDCSTYAIRGDSLNGMETGLTPLINGQMR